MKIQTNIQILPSTKTVFKANRKDIYKSGTPYEYSMEIFQKNFAKKLENKKEKLYEYLDSIEVDGEENYIRKELARMLGNESQEMHNVVYCKTSCNKFEKMLKRGFDIKKISPSLCGPGGDLFINEDDTLPSECIFKACYSGNTAINADLRDYNSLNEKISNKIMDYLGDSHNDVSFRILKQIELRKFISEYTRQIIVNELGIDGAYFEEDKKFFTVFNPDSISYIEEI